MKYSITSFFLFTSILLHGGTFSFKLDLHTVDHHPIEKTVIYAIHQGVEVERLETSDDDVKMKLEEGKLYDVWIRKAGYLPHVIHNVHDEGDRKFDVTLYKGTTGDANWTNYLVANRTFDDVKKMTIPADQLGTGVQIVKKEALTEEEQEALDSIRDLAKDQRKAQKKIDKLLDKRAEIDEEIKELNEDIAANEVDRTSGEEKKLSLQKDIVKIQNKLDDLRY